MLQLQLSGDVRATEIKKTLLREKISLIQDAKVNNEEAGTLRSEVGPTHLTSQCFCSV